MNPIVHYGLFLLDGTRLVRIIFSVDINQVPEEVDQYYGEDESKDWFMQRLSPYYKNMTLLEVVPMAVDDVVFHKEDE